jgi:16S rRNA (guanine527-N7)-methyltransferase
LAVDESLQRAAASLGVPLGAAEVSKLLRLLDELERWNRTYNLTAIRERTAMLTHHLLDSLSVHGELLGTCVADVGTGAGFPGLPLAVVNPQRHFTLIDSSGKKIRFVAHAARALGLTNVSALQQRVADCKPARPFDTIVARAFAPLPKLLREVTSLGDAHTRILAMKGKWPTAELDELDCRWRHDASHTIDIPGLEEARCVIVLSQT